LAKLRSARIPCGPVNTLSDILSDEHFLARGGVVELDHPLVGTVKMLANPIRLSETPPIYRRHPPTLGEHNEEILLELGYSAADIAEFRAAGAT
jgi:crotonobetainyl-CoA:carnitine CoA-transferase CaiB-like acyl-CoA transferase